jgi:hypothetical protein
VVAFCQSLEISVYFLRVCLVRQLLREKPGFVFTAQQYAATYPNRGQKLSEHAFASSLVLPTKTSHLDPASACRTHFRLWCQGCAGDQSAVLPVQAALIYLDERIRNIVVFVLVTCLVKWQHVSQQEGYRFTLCKGTKELHLRTHKSTYVSKHFVRSPSKAGYIFLYRV